MTTTPRGRFHAPVPVLLLATAALLACSDVLGSGEQIPEIDLELLEPGIHPVLVVADQTSSDATVELHLVRVEVDALIASFQGELRYDVKELSLTGAQVPAGITGAWNEVEDGIVRFAGVSPAGIEGGPVLSLAFETRRAVREEAFELTIEELVASEAFQSLAPSLQQDGPRPLFSRNPH